MNSNVIIFIVCFILYLFLFSHFCLLCIMFLLFFLSFILLMWLSVMSVYVNNIRSFLMSPSPLYNIFFFIKIKFEIQCFLSFFGACVKCVVNVGIQHVGNWIFFNILLILFIPYFPQQCHFTHSFVLKKKEKLIAPFLWFWSEKKVDFLKFSLKRRYELSYENM